MELTSNFLSNEHEQATPIVIAGPCSAESEDQVMETARMLAAMGVRIFRAGIWKPRTKPGCFEGKGAEALPWLKEVKAETGMAVITEVATPEHVDLALQYGVDYLWIGARTTTNPFAVQALADCLQGVDVPVLVKNPVNPDLDLWIGALERLNRAGITRLAAVHRGFSYYGKKMYRNVPMWQIPIELRRRLPELPVFCDPSHIGGRRELIEPLCQQALDLGCEGLMIESHVSPDQAWSDAQQQITPASLSEILGRLVIRRNKSESAEIKEMRLQIDDIDNQILELLSKRLHVCREIGEYKKSHNMPVLQPTRYDEVLYKRGLNAKICGLAPDFVKRIFEEIHEESVKLQMGIAGNP